MHFEEYDLTPVILKTGDNSAGPPELSIYPLLKVSNSRECCESVVRVLKYGPMFLVVSEAKR